MGMATSTIVKPISSCNVDKGLLGELEGIVLQKATDLEGGALGQSHRYYQVELSDRNRGSLRVNGVDELPLSPMPNDIQSISIWAFCNDDARGQLYSIKIVFSAQGNIVPLSQYEISVTGDTARELAIGIEGMIRSAIERRAYAGIIRNPSNATVLFSILATGIVLQVIGIGLLSLHFTIACGLFTASILVYLMLWALTRLPHCIFDNQENKDRFDRLKWFIRALLCFVIFTVIGGLLIEYLKRPIANQM
jgi:hypothetical protein